MSDETKTMTNGGPDRTVADSPERIIEALMRIHSMRMECCLPAIVKDYNRTSHLALVQPLTNIVSSDGEQMERADIIVPVRRIQHGAFLIDFPIYKGDTGWIIAADRDSETSLLSNSGDVNKDSNPNQGGQKPSTGILHKYRFGFFIPDRWGNIDIEEDYGAGEDDAVICSRNGKTKIVISQEGDVEISLDQHEGNANLVINSNVTMSGNLSVSGDMNISEGSLTISKNEQIVSIDEGSISASSSISAEGDVHSEANVISEKDVIVNSTDNTSIRLKSHIHTFEHTHKDSLGGTTTSEDPIKTQSPDPMNYSQHVVSVTVNLSESGSGLLSNVLWDQNDKNATGTQSQTHNIGDITSGTASFTADIVKQNGSSFENNPYIRIQMRYKSSGYKFPFYPQNSSASIENESGTIWPAEGSVQMGGTTATSIKCIFIDCSEFLNREYYMQKDFSININLGNFTLGSSYTGSDSVAIGSISASNLLATITVS